MNVYDWLAYGVPEKIVVDNDSANESGDIEEFCSVLGIEVQYLSYYPFVIFIELIANDYSLAVGGTPETYGKKA